MASTLAAESEQKDITNIQSSEDEESQGGDRRGEGSIHGNARNNNSVDTNYQVGVQKAEAVTISWTKRILILACMMIWLMHFAQGIVNGVSGALIPYVTSSFSKHSLIPTTGVLSQVIGGVSNLAIAKVLDVFGRPHGFLLCVFSAVIGFVMSAGCENVETYAAAQIFFTVGANGVGYTLSVFVADISSLRHRGLIQSLVVTPVIITSFVAGPIAQSLLRGPGWRWAYGMNSILLPGVALPLFGLFIWQYMKAKKQGIVLVKSSSGRTLWQSFMYYMREFDVVGLLLVSAGFAFFLLPFNLYTMQAKGWGSALIICFLVFGILLLIAFVVWEKFAPVSLTPWEILLDRTVLGCCITGLGIFVSTTAWNSYFSSFLQVVNGLSVADAAYVVQGGTVVQIISGIFAGAVISWTGRYKAISLYFAFPLMVLGMGLMIYFRQPTHYVG